MNKYWILLLIIPFLPTACAPFIEGVKNTPPLFWLALVDMLSVFGLLIWWTTWLHNKHFPNEKL